MTGPDHELRRDVRRTLRANHFLLAALLALGAFLCALQVDLWPPKAQAAPIAALQRITLFDLPVTGGANIITTSLTVKDDRLPATAFRYTWLIKDGQTDSVVQPVVICGGVSLVGALNTDAVLTEGCWYSFGLGGARYTTETAPREISWNVRAATTTVLAYLDIQEVQ